MRPGVQSFQKKASVTEGGRLIKPGVIGGMNWQPAAFDPQKGLIFVPAVESASVFTKSDPDKIVRGKTGLLLGSGGVGRRAANLLGTRTRCCNWCEKMGIPRPTRSEFRNHSGLLATAGGLVFGASSGVLFALDAATGQELWRLPVGGNTLAAPISFKLEGRQVIAVLAGQSLIVFGL